MATRTLADDFAFFQDLWYGRPGEAQSYGLLSGNVSTNAISAENPRATWLLPRQQRQQRRHADRQHRKHVERELRKIHG